MVYFLWNWLSCEGPPAFSPHHSLPSASTDPAIVWGGIFQVKTLTLLVGGDDPVIWAVRSKWETAGSYWDISFSYFCLCHFFLDTVFQIEMWIWLALGPKWSSWDHEVKTEDHRPFLLPAFPPLTIDQRCPFYFQNQAERNWETWLPLAGSAASQ